MIGASISAATGLFYLDFALRNRIGMEGSLMDWEDLMDWQRVILGGDPAPESAEVAVSEPASKPLGRAADLPDPMHSNQRVWGHHD